MTKVSISEKVVVTPAVRARPGMGNPFSIVTTFDKATAPCSKGSIKASNLLSLSEILLDSSDILSN